MFPALAARIVDYAEAAIQVEPGSAVERDRWDGLHAVAWQELVVTSASVLPLLGRALAATRGMEALHALARHRLVGRMSDCQMSYHVALTLALTAPIDRTLSLISSGLLETFTKLYVGGNCLSSSVGANDGQRMPAGGTLRSPYAECASKMAQLAQSPALRSSIRGRLAPLLSPMILGLQREARSHEYGAPRLRLQLLTAQTCTTTSSSSRASSTCRIRAYGRCAAPWPTATRPRSRHAHAALSSTFAARPTSSSASTMP